MQSNGFNNLEEILELAIDRINNQMGVITINIAGIPKISASNDIIGNCIQEWIPQWLEDNGVEMRANERSQQFPDFIASVDGKKYAMEVKCWNGLNAPAFDLANFDSFYRAVYENPAVLDAKYLIFSYIPTAHGFQITNIYLKNIWEITSPARFYPVGLQVKYDRPYAIRPFAFHRNPANCFENRRNFVLAIRETRRMYPQLDGIEPDEWFRDVEIYYHRLTGLIL